MAAGAEHLVDGWPAGISPGAGLVLATLWLLSATVVGPVTEEIYFRGLLQPMIPGGRAARILSGSALFALYHVWQPWTWVTVLFATLPIAWVRERTGSTPLCAAIHVTVNLVAFALLAVGLLSR